MHTYSRARKRAHVHAYATHTHERTHTHTHIQTEIERERARGTEDKQRDRQSLTSSFLQCRERVKCHFLASRRTLTQQSSARWRSFTDVITDAINTYRRDQRDNAFSLSIAMRSPLSVLY
ncbi:hypothetical protein EVAR_4849_1 [Eumeta japonica]|uniref:Uncharacterized protein n=1 Tax=Eumeta variegata TaxID=151549 RepID=A0A4C1T047_EUMVA|nr:hypothetical protein EVAR_4849_1 [Eumeta japonica]